MRFITAKWGGAVVLSLLMLACSNETYGQREELETVRGTVKGFTEAPKGEVDGMALSDGTVVHWPPHLERRFTAIVKRGDQVEVTGRREALPKGEIVLEASTVTNLATRESFTNEDDAPPPPKGKKDKGKKAKDRERIPGPDRTVTGRVERFTEAPKGEVDGVALSDGTIVHWPPHLERRFAAIVKQGDRVRVVGWDETTPRGERVLEVRSLTNLATRATRVNEDAPPAPAEAQARPDDVERRLRALEDKLDALLAEMRRRKK